MRKDLENAKAYKIGYKALSCGDRSFTMEVVNTLEEAMKKLEKWESLGWQTKIMAVR